MSERNPVRGLIKIQSNKIPETPISSEAMIPSCTLILPAGNGLVAVRFISLSVSRSITWLKPLDDAVTNIPPVRTSMRVLQSSAPFSPRRYPIAADKTTSVDKRILMNCA